MSDKPYKIEINLDQATDWASNTASEFWHDPVKASDDHPYVAGTAAALVVGGAAIGALAFHFKGGAKIAEELTGDATKAASSGTLADNSAKVAQNAARDEFRFGIQMQDGPGPKILELTERDLVRSAEHDNNRILGYTRDIRIDPKDPGAAINLARRDFLNQWHKVAGMTMEDHIAANRATHSITRIDANTHVSTIPMGSMTRGTYRTDDQVNSYFEVDPNRKYLATADFTSGTARIYSEHNGNMLRTNIFADGSTRSSWLPDDVEPKSIVANYINKSSKDVDLTKLFFK